MKTHIVREAFSLDGKDYARGAELTDPAIIEKARRSHPGHLVQQNIDVAEPAEEQQPVE